MAHFQMMYHEVPFEHNGVRSKRVQTKNWIWGASHSWTNPGGTDSNPKRRSTDFTKVFFQAREVLNKGVSKLGILDLKVGFLDSTCRQHRKRCADGGPVRVHPYAFRGIMSCWKGW